MAPIRRITTLERAATILSAAEDWLGDIHIAMGARRGAVWIDDGTEDGMRGFTEVGMDALAELVADLDPEDSSPS
jgi:hypothetical protein